MNHNIELDHTTKSSSITGSCPRETPALVVAPPAEAGRFHEDAALGVSLSFDSTLLVVHTASWRLRLYALPSAALAAGQLHGAGDVQSDPAGGARELQEQDAVGAAARDPGPGASSAGHAVPASGDRRCGCAG